MKILFLINSLSGGGAEKVLSFLALECARRGDEVTIATFTGEESLPGLRIVRLTNKKGVLSIFSLRKALKALLLKERFTVAVSFMDQANMLLLSVTPPPGLRRIISERVAPEKSSIMEWPRPLSTILNRIRYSLYRRADKIIVQTEKLRHRFLERGLERTVTIPNPLLPRSTEPAAPLLPLTVVGMGRLVAQKRFDLLIRAFASVLPHFPEWRLTIFGAGPLREDLERLARTLRVPVSFPGTTKNAREVFNSTEIFVLSSDYEGFPNVLVEAMAEGRAVIATDCPYGPEEIINDGENGLLVPKGDAVALAHALRKLMESKELRESLGAHAKEVRTSLAAPTLFDKFYSAIR